MYKRKENNMNHKLGTPCLFHDKPEFMFVGVPATQYAEPGYMLFPLSVYNEIERNPSRVYNATFQGKHGVWVSSQDVDAAVQAASSVTILKTPFGDIESKLIFHGDTVKMCITQKNAGAERVLANISVTEFGVLGQMFADNAHEDRACLWVSTES